VRRSKQQTRLRILDASFGLFWRQGFLRVSMDDIAARAGITKRALYQHFPSKDDLMAATLAHSSKLAIERLRTFRRFLTPTNSSIRSSPIFRNGRQSRNGQAAASPASW
jgi:AcrR family transcriptional regulator